MGKFLIVIAAIAIAGAVGAIMYGATMRWWAKRHCPVCLNGGDVRDYPTGWSDSGLLHNEHLWMCRKHLAQRQHIDTLEHDLGNL